tara:strand:+ start:465 stop:644 length:180 start_codon:yes stop_codon:yes gene_type:complete
LKEVVILVNEKDLELGYMGKTETHLRWELHREISVFISNNNGEMLLQRRDLEKYHPARL